VRSRKYAAARAAIVKLAHDLKPKHRGWLSLNEIASTIKKSAGSLDPENPTVKAFSAIKPTSWSRYCAETLKNDLSKDAFEMLFLKSGGLAD
jgi:hypothetical protein